MVAQNTGKYEKPSSFGSPQALIGGIKLKPHSTNIVMETTRKMARSFGDALISVWSTRRPLRNERASSLPERPRHRSWFKLTPSKPRPPPLWLSKNHSKRFKSARISERQEN